MEVERDKQVGVLSPRGIMPIERPIKKATRAILLIL